MVKDGAPSGIVTLLTDFGRKDAYVGAMKGVLLSRLPGLTLVDLTHAVEPQAVAQGAFLLSTAWRYYPTGTVHLAVVDPGVGSLRLRLALAAEEHYFVGPDNGLLSSALPDSARGERGPAEGYEARAVKLPTSVRAFAIENQSLLPGRTSATFEGRDVFAPAAAFLAGGGEIAALGRRVDSVLAMPAFRAPALGDEMEGVVIHVDSFGNLITDVRAEDLPARPAVVIGGLRLTLARTYATAEGLTGIVGSSGLLEIALPNGNAAQLLGLGRGARVSILP